jgi:Holliday junction resolvase-like predicted endonuclease
MAHLSVWHIKEEGPVELPPASINLEKDLEGWIEKDPALLQRGLTIVGRQFHTEGGPIDLLGLDPQGRWCVIELKAGQVLREAIAQAIDYASCIASMPAENLRARVDSYLKHHGRSADKLADSYPGVFAESDTARDVMIFAVGAGPVPGLERMIDFMAGQHNFPITGIYYQVLEPNKGERILIRELTEADAQPKTGGQVNGLLRIADSKGTGAPIRLAMACTEELGLYSRIWKSSIMFAPPSHHGRCLFTLWVDPTKDGKIKAWIGPEVFPDFFNVTLEEAKEALGASGWRNMTLVDVEGFCAHLHQLLGDGRP